MTASSSHTTTYANLIRWRRRVCVHHFVNALVRAVLVWLVLVTVLAALTVCLRPGVMIRTAMAVLLTVTGLVFPLLFAGLAWRRCRWLTGHRGLQALAYDIGKGRIRGDALGNALGLLALEPESVLAQEAFHQALAAHDWLRCWQESLKELKQRLWEKRLAVMLVVTMMAWLLPGKPLNTGVHWLLHSNEEIPLPFSLHLEPERSWLAAGDTLRVTVQCVGADLPDEVLLEIRGEKGRVRRLAGAPEREFAIAGESQDFLLLAKSGRVLSDTLHMPVVQPPLLRRLDLTVRPPAYTGEAAVKLPSNQGNVDVLAGSMLLFRGLGSKALEGGRIVFDNRRAVTLSVEDSLIQASAVLDSSDAYHISLQDMMGLKNRSPLRYHVSVFPDRPPAAMIVRPQFSMDLNENMTVPLLLRAHDDYGISRLRLGYAVLSGQQTDTLQPRYMPLTADSVHDRTHFVRFDWAVDTLGMLPGDHVLFFLEATDNNTRSGPQVSRSAWVTARFPSMDEIFAEMESGNESLLSEVESVAEDQARLRERLNEVKRKLQTGQELGWEDRQAVDELVREQQSLKEKLKKIENEMSQHTRDLDDRQMARAETLEKMDEIRKLFEELNAPELSQAAQRLQQAVKRPGAEQMNQAMENMEAKLDALQQSLERTIELLKRAALEQRMDGLIRQVESLAANQQQLNEGVESGLVERDFNAQSGGIQAAQREMNDIHAAMQSMDQMPEGEMNEAVRRQNARELSETVKSQKEASAARQSEAAREAGQKAMAGLTQWAEDLNKVKEAMTGEHQRKIQQALSRYQERMMQISQHQEQLFREARQQETSSRDLAPRQQAMAEHLEQLADSLATLMKESYFVPFEILQQVGQSRDAMARSVGQMGQSGQTPTAMMGQALALLNQAQLSLDNARQNGQSGQSGSAMQQLMDGLNSITSEQQAMQQQMMDWLNQGALSPAQQAAARRMAGQQRALGEELGRLLDELGQSSELQGRLEQLEEEMEALAAQLEQSGIDRESVQREQRIISRLLEAQHAAREQDSGRRRKGETGRDVLRSSPPALQALDAWRRNWRQQLMELEASDYPAAYKELIRRYFQLLMEEASQ